MDFEAEIAKEAEYLGVKPRHIDLLLSEMHRDRVATLSKDGSMWLQKEGGALLPFTQGLREILQSDYSQYLPPRGATVEYRCPIKYVPSNYA
jgi:hypothetical protein